MGKTPYTRESIERALQHHQDAGYIGRWYRQADGYSVQITDFPPAQLRSLRETYVFVLGLGSASKAADRKLSAYYAISAQVETRDGDYQGSRGVPTFYLHETVQGIRSEDDAKRVAADILTSTVGADSAHAAPIPTLHITAVKL